MFNVFNAARALLRLTKLKAGWPQFSILAAGLVNPQTGNLTHYVNTAGTLVSAVDGTPGGVQAMVAAGAVSLTTATTTIASAGAIALTLAAGVNGQKKRILMITDGGDATLTGVFGPTGTTIVFNDVGDSALLQYLNSKWYPISLVGVVVA